MLPVALEAPAVLAALVVQVAMANHETDNSAILVAMLLVPSEHLVAGRLLLDFPSANLEVEVPLVLVKVSHQPRTQQSSNVWSQSDAA